MSLRVVVCGFAFVASTLFGCGGGGNGGSGLHNPLTGTLTVTPGTASYGQNVTVTWATENASFEVDDNIYTESHGQTPPLNGSLTYKASLSETFTISFRRFADQNDPEQTLELTATLTVPPTDEKYLVIGQSNNAGVIAIVNALQGITTQPITVQTTIPAPDGIVDAIILDQSGSFGPADIPTVRAYLQQGKGVVMVRAAPRLLASGDVNNGATNNIANIQSWFGSGPTLITSSGNAHAKAGTDVIVPLTLVNSRRPGIGPTFEMEQANAGADVVCQAEHPIGNNNFIIAFGYRPAEGGRVYYQANTTFLDDPILLAAGARWAATSP